VEETIVTVCVAVSRAVIVGKFNTRTERVRERERERERRQYARGYARYVTRMQDITANRIKVFKFCLLNCARGSMEFIYLYLFHIYLRN
jgi:hypothetical protein